LLVPRLSLLIPRIIRTSEGFGYEGFRVEHPSEIQEAVRGALKQEKPTVIDVGLEKSEGLRSIRGAQGHAG
jgi:thiamine pyrophosphate-dependent acetolactate synthase large subunit-like protein